MITKGGHGSGIRGHRTIRDAVSSLDDKKKAALLSKLQAEKAKRAGGNGSGGSSNIQRYPSGKMPKKDMAALYAQINKWSGQRRGMALGAYGSSGQTIHLLKDGKDVKGIASTYVEGKSLVLDRLATKESGHGKNMMNDIMKAAAEQGLGVTLHAEDGAIGFYQKLGMKEKKGKEGSFFSFSPEEVKTRTKGADDLKSLEPKNGVFTKPMKKKEASTEKADVFIAKVFERVKQKLAEQEEEKSVSKEDWIQAWKDNPHWDKRKPSKLVNRLLNEIGGKPEDLSVLEIGCGNGVDSIAFGEAGCKTIGIDISPDAIKLAKKNNDSDNVTFEVGDAEKLKFKDGQFDAVFSMAVLHSTDLSKSIPEMSRVMKDGGKALLFLYQKTEYEYNDETEENFKFKEIEKLFRSNGFRINGKKLEESRDKDENGVHYHYIVIYTLTKED